MKRIASLVLTLVAILAIAPVITIAQAPANTGLYTVEPNDTAWDLAGRYYNNPTTWQRIVDMNPFLQEPGRVFTKGNPDKVGENRIILILKPGEQLVGLERIGVAPPTAVPIGELVAPATPIAATDTNLNWFAWLPWLLLAAMIIVIMWFAWGIWRDRRDARLTEERMRIEAERRREQEALARREAREREMTRPVETAGPPMVPGGIPPTETAQLTNFFDEQARARFTELRPNYHDQAALPERISPIEHGMIGGEGEVKDIQGNWHPRRVDPAQPGYQARFRFPDGTEEVMQAFEICMNIVRRGEGMRGFAFTPRATAVPTPEPSRPAPEAVPHPAIAIRRIREAAQAEHQNTLAIGDEVMVFPLGYHLTVDRTTNDIRLESDSVQMTLKTKAQAAASNESSAATGTSGE